MTKCWICDQPYDNSGGGILVNVCPTCRKRPPSPESYVSHGGVLVPNPEYDVWKEQEAERVRQIKAKAAA